MSRRVLITGGSGFIGANLARRAVQDGHEVHLLVRPGHEGWRLRERAGAFAHQVDLTDGDGVRAAVASIRPQWVFHLAAYGAYARQAGFERMLATNVGGCVHLVDACQSLGVEACINAGSSSEYGYREGAAREDDRLEPNSHYAVTKAAATHYCQLASRLSDVNVTTVRLYSVYGPYEAPDRLIPTLLVHGLHQQLPPLVSPDTARDFIYVDDAVDAMLHLAASPQPSRGAIYNVCTGVQTSLRELVGVARELLGVSADPAWESLPPRPWDTASWVGSPARLEEEHGWRAPTRLAEGLRKTLDWLRAEPARLRFYAGRVLERAVAGDRRE